MNNNKCTLIDIKWERIFLELILKADKVDKIVLQNEKKNNEIELNYEVIDKNLYSIKINITNIMNNNFLKNDNWKLFVKYKDKYYLTEISYDLAYKIEDKSRIFYYHPVYAYTISFKVYSDDDITLNWQIISMFMKQNNNVNRNDFFLESKTLSQFFKNIVLSFFKVIANFLYKLFSLFSNKNKKRIIFVSETKNEISGNLKAIYNRMIELNLDKKYNISYFCSKTIIKYNPFNILKYIIKLSNKNIIIVDDYAPILGSIKLKKHVKFIQTWHAGLGFKSVGYSRFGKDGSPHPTKSVHRKYTQVISSSDEFTEALMEVFGLDKSKFINTGMARLDNFLDKDLINKKKEKIYKKYPNLIGKKIILFAPTYRGKNQESAYYDINKLDLNRIDKFCGDKYIFAIKLHPFIEQKIDYKKYKNIIDISNYIEINDLYYIMDILITDYSSNYYEASILKKPIIFYTYDRQIYELTRGVHRSIKDNAPGKVCDSFEELMYSLENQDYNLEKTIQFADKEFNLDNKSCDRIINNILN